MECAWQNGLIPLITYRKLTIHSKKVGCQSEDKMKQTKWTKMYQLQLTPQNCLVPRPHYSVQLIRFGSLGPSKEVRPRQKSSKVRQKWDIPCRGLQDQSFKVKNTPLKDTDGKGKFKRMLSFLLIDKGRLFFIKLTLVRNSKFSSWRSTWPVLKQN